MAHPTVTIQISPESQPSTPFWLGEVAVFAQVLTQAGILKAIQDRVRFARARFGQYDLIDFVAVLIGYVLSSEPTLLAFYERLAPFAKPFMALFGRNHLPHRSTLSRFLAVLDQNTVEALRARFQEDCSLGTRLHLPAACSTGQESPGSWLMWMEPDKPLANVRFRSWNHCLLPIVVLTKSARRAIRGASGEK
jgi:hypothetical protein